MLSSYKLHEFKSSFDIERVLEPFSSTNIVISLQKFFIAHHDKQLCRMSYNDQFAVETHNSRKTYSMKLLLFLSFFFRVYSD